MGAPYLFVHPDAQARLFRAFFAPFSRCFRRAHSMTLGLGWSPPERSPCLSFSPRKSRASQGNPCAPAEAAFLRNHTDRPTVSALLIIEHPVTPESSLPARIDSISDPRIELL